MGGKDTYRSADFRSRGTLCAQTWTTIRAGAIPAALLALVAHGIFELLGLILIPAGLRRRHLSVQSLMSRNAAAGITTMYVSTNAVFRVHRPWDRNFILLLVGLIWAAVFAGFGPQIAKHLTTDAAPYPLIVHAHAAAFVGWLVFLTLQTLLIRTNHRPLHRKLDVAGLVTAALVLRSVPAAH